MAKIQTLEQFQKTFGVEPVEVTLEEFGKDATFFLKPLKSADRDNFEASVVGIDGNRNLLNLRARLVSLAWCDASETSLARKLRRFRLPSIPTTEASKLSRSADFSGFRKKVASLPNSSSVTSTGS